MAGVYITEIDRIVVAKGRLYYVSGLAPSVKHAHSSSQVDKE